MGQKIAVKKEQKSPRNTRISSLPFENWWCSFSISVARKIAHKQIEKLWELNVFELKIGTIWKMEEEKTENKKKKLHFSYIRTRAKITNKFMSKKSNGFLFFQSFNSDFSLRVCVFSLEG